MTPSHKQRCRIIPLFIAALVLLSGLGQAQTGSGTVVGTVRGPTGDALANVGVSVAGTNLSTTTDLSGSYRLGNVPVGEQTVVYSYIGMGATTATVTVVAGQPATSDVRLSYSEAIEVSGSPLLQGQAKALNTQQQATNITNVVSSDQMSNFPDLNVAEATQRIPAISLLRDQGEGRYVIVRGTEPRLNSTTVNGERLPASEGDQRSMALDTIPAELLEAIQVSKALTPDMDGDAIGGTVDLVTKRAPLEGTTQVSVGGGYTAIAEDTLGIAAFTLGRRYDEAKTGLLLSLSASRRNAGSDDIEPVYDDGDLDELGLRDYTFTRDRYGATLSLDRQLSFDSQLFVRALWDEYSDSEYRREKANVLGDDAIEWALRDREQNSRVLSFTAGGNNLVGETAINYRVAWNKSEEETPDQLTSVFIQEDVEFDPNVSPDFIDPNNIQANPLNEDYTLALFDSMESQAKSASEEDLVGAIDVAWGFYRDSGFSGLWKVGAKVRFKDKTQNYEVFDYESEDDLFMADYIDDWTPDTPFFDGRYTFGPFMSPDQMRALFASGALEGERNLEEDLVDYNFSEDTYAGYAMGEFDISSKVTLLAGLRAEKTDTTFTAYELIYDEEGEPSDLIPTEGDKSFTEWLPMVHLKYKLGESSYLRAAITRTFARPNFGDQVPWQLTNDEDREIERGNPDLNYTTSWNGDLLIEHYLPSVGILSGGIFYKELTDNIYLSTIKQEIDGEEYDVTQPFNADSGWLRGFEFAFQRRFGVFGLYLNYTYADSESNYPTREDTRLPGQSEHVGNLALSLEAGGFSGRIALNYNGSSLFAVGEDPATDQYVDDHLQLDFSAQQRLGKNVSLYLEAVNLTDEPYRVYEGTSDRPLQEEYYMWWGTIGVKLNF
jgi:TonB-dependent receptor